MRDERLARLARWEMSEMRGEMRDERGER